MATVRWHWQEEPPPEVQGAVLTLGNFDGVHRGHVHLLNQAKEMALRVPIVAATFEPHPLQLLRPEQFEPTLTTLDDRADLLQAHGADHALLLQADLPLLQLPAAQFFAEVLRGKLKIAGMVEGPNFQFGKGREGNVALLASLCERAKIPFQVASPLQEGGVMVSSSRIRHALQEGEVGTAAIGLGRSYQIHGRVGRGDERGRTLGFPTANLQNIATLIPGDGVYAVRAYVGQDPWPGAANIGPNPTFGVNERKVEVHLIGFSGDLYGQELSVSFLERLRATQRFNGVEELRAQLQTDVANALNILGQGTGKSR